MLASRGKPGWLSIRPPSSEFVVIKDIVKKNNLHTVCEESHCPNMSECWSGGTATFMVMGDICTRACKFCAVKTGYPAAPLDPKEPENLAVAVNEMGIEYVVVTSVDRDDLKDQGASHFAACIEAIRRRCSVRIEVLIPDFRGNLQCLETIIKAKPTVIAHNIETVRRLQSKVRDPRAGYEQSLKLLRAAKVDGILTKSAIMIGLGENDDEVLQAIRDLRDIKVDILTIGQYLRPSSWHLPVSEYVHPEKFAWYKEQAEKMGFLYVASGPFVRSSYKAADFFRQLKL